MDSAVLTLPVGATENTVRVHPVVVFTICDAYIRRNENQERVIGTLLGTISDGVVDIKNCYAVPHSESNDQVAVDVVHHQTMAELQKRVNSSERIVGWFSTGAGVSGSDALIHNFYTNECPNPVHLILDTTLSGDYVSREDSVVKAFVSRVLSIQGNQLAREFQEVPCEVKSSEAERIVGDLLLSEKTDHLPMELEGLAETLKKLDGVIGGAEAYVNGVVAGSVEGDVAVGRQIAEALSAVPRLSTADLEKLVRNNQNDVLLTTYLADLIRAQVALSDRLGTMQLPLV
jgi:translation initiation factor 3 subunit F